MLTLDKRYFGESMPFLDFKRPAHIQEWASWGKDDPKEVRVKVPADIISVEEAIGAGHETARTGWPLNVRDELWQTPFFAQDERVFLNRRNRGDIHYTRMPMSAFYANQSYALDNLVITLRRRIDDPREKTLLATPQRVITAFSAARSGKEAIERYAKTMGLPIL